MSAMTLESAKTIGIVVVAVLLALAVASAWIMKTFAQRVAVIVILCLLAALVWSQRASLQDCADRVRQNVTVAAGAAAVDTTCTFFGQDVTVETSRAG